MFASTTKKWTREQSIQYSMNHEASSEEDIIAEIERYMANPGEALSYKIGELKIKELRDTAKKELGDKFDIRQYHNQALATGCVKPEILKKQLIVGFQNFKPFLPKYSQKI